MFRRRKRRTLRETGDETINIKKLKKVVDKGQAK